MRLTPPALAAVVLLGLGAVAAATLLLFRKEPTPEELIRARIDAMVEAAEKKDLAALMEPISERFSGMSGMKKPELKGFLTAQLLRGQFVRVVVRELLVEVHSDLSATFKGTFLFGRSGNPVGPAADKLEDLKSLVQGSDLGAWDVQGDVEREPDGEWRITRAVYHRVEVEVP